MNSQRLNATRIAACVLTCSLASAPGTIMAVTFAAVAEVIDSRCMSCHDSDTREGGIDLSPLLQKANGSDGEFTKRWIKVERMVARGEMPPDTEERLAPDEREAITQWFRESFVLRKGKAHIGPTPLRRLTRYELQNTLEDVLSINLKASSRDGDAAMIRQSAIESLIPSDIPGESGFDNDAHRMGKLKPPLQEIAEAVDYAVAEFIKDAEARKAVLGQAELPKDASDDEIRQIITRLLTRVLRGNQDRVQLYQEVYHDLYRRSLRDLGDSNASLRHVFKMILVSPEFLYRLEESKDLDTPYPVSGVELATRLSYFLWATTPDDELLRLGRDGSLLEDDVLKAQVTRMLNSPKRLSLVENFAGQWLGFNELLSNSEYLLNDQWNRETYDEALYFFDELIKSDRSLLELVQSDWIYKRATALKAPGHGYSRIDARSIEHRYGDVLSDRLESQGNRLQADPPVLVKTKDEREGGIITSAAIMRLTASKSRTSPIRRGVWILSTIIGRDLEPPPNIPSLNEARAALKLKRDPTVAELLQQHVAKVECVSCHKAIDPLGLGLENFGPTGRWRTRYTRKEPVASSGVMPNGKTFKSPREMKLLLVEIYKDEIARNFVGQMFAYAIGRKLKPHDRVSLDSMVAKVKEDGYKVSTVIEQIVLSKQFRYRQDR